MTNEIPDRTFWATTKAGLTRNSVGFSCKIVYIDGFLMAVHYLL